MSATIEAVRLFTETMLSLAAAARQFPGRNGRSHVNASTVWRWTEKGVRTSNGIVKLERVRSGSVFYTTLESILRFKEALNAPAATRPHPSPAFRTPGQRRRAKKHADRRAAAVEKKLEAMMGV
jgi:hypothetical protein